MEASGGGGYADGSAALVESPPRSLRLPDAAPHPQVDPGADSRAQPGRAPSPSERRELLDTVVSMCASAPGARRRDAREALGAIFLRLVVDAEHDIRLRLAERIADADWAPPALIRTLALDDIDIARPVIAASTVLQDEDLLGILARATGRPARLPATRPHL